jgi:hypothetical protein
MGCVRIPGVAVNATTVRTPTQDRTQDDGRDRVNPIDVAGADGPSLSDRTTDVHKITHDTTDFNAESIS